MWKYAQVIINMSKNIAILQLRLRAVIRIPELHCRNHNLRCSGLKLSIVTSKSKGWWLGQWNAKLEGPEIESVTMGNGSSFTVYLILVQFTMTKQLTWCKQYFSTKRKYLKYFQKNIGETFF